MLPREFRHLVKSGFQGVGGGLLRLMSAMIVFQDHKFMRISNFKLIRANYDSLEQRITDFSNWAEPTVQNKHLIEPNSKS